MDKNRNTFRLSVLMLVLALCGQSGLHLLFHAAVPTADSCCQSVSAHRAPTERRLSAADLHDYSRWLDFSGNYCPCCAGGVFAAMPESFGRPVTEAAAEKIRPGLFSSAARDEIAAIHPRAPPVFAI